MFVVRSRMYLDTDSSGESEIQKERKQGGNGRGERFDRVSLKTSIRVDCGCLWKFL